MAGRRRGTTMTGAWAVMTAATLACGDSSQSTSTGSATTTAGTTTSDTTTTSDGTTTGVPTTGATTGAGSDSVSATGGTTSGGTTGATDPSAGTGVDSTGDTTSGTTGGDSTSGGSTGVPIEPACSDDLHNVVDQFGSILQTCPPDQGCAAGACVPACDAAAASQANFGCTFIAPTPPAYPPALPPCFAVFVANKPPSPVKPPQTRRCPRSPRIRPFGGRRAFPPRPSTSRNFPPTWQRSGSGRTSN